MDRIPRIHKGSAPKQSKLSKKKGNSPPNNRSPDVKHDDKIKVQVTGYDCGNSKVSLTFEKHTLLSEVKLMISQKLRTMGVNMANIIGFQSQISNFPFDYKLQAGIGYLDVDIKIKCFHLGNNQKGLEKYKICCCLAIGGFSKVFLVRSKESGKFYAAKFIDKSKQCSSIQLLLNEKEVSLSLNSPFLVKTYEFHQTDEFFVFIMDYCPGGELFYLLKHIKYMSQEEARLCFIQVLLGIQYLHNLGYMYRDLKPENVLLDCYGFLKIADFGLAKPHSSKSYSFCGSVQYMAPQILRGKGHEKLVDFYCLGALLYEMLIGHPPFYENNATSEQTKKKILQNKIEFPKGSISPLAQDLIVRLTQKNEKQRLGYFGGCREIMAHPWVGKINRKIFQQRNYNPPFPVNLNRLNFDPEEIGKSQRIFEERINLVISSKMKNQQIVENKKKVSLSFLDRKKSLSQRLGSRKSKSPYRNKSLLNYCQKKSKSPYQYILKKAKSGKIVKTQQNQQGGSRWIEKKFIKNLRWTEKSEEGGKENKLIKNASKLRKKCIFMPFQQQVKMKSFNKAVMRQRNEIKKKEPFPSFSTYLF